MRAWISRLSNKVVSLSELFWVDDMPFWVAFWLAFWGKGSKMDFIGWENAKTDLQILWNGCLKA